MSFCRNLSIDLSGAGWSLLKSADSSNPEGYAIVVHDDHQKPGHPSIPLMEVREYTPVQVSIFEAR